MSMEINSVYGSSYSASTSNAKKTTSETEEAGKTSKMSEAEEMAAFKKEFYEDMKKIRVDSSIVNVAIHISEEAFKNMKDDPEYREKILSLLQRDLGSYYGSGPRRASVMLTVGATSKDYRGDSWPICNDSEFYDRSVGSFYKRFTGKKDKTDKKEDVLEKYLEKKAQAKKLQEELWKEDAARQELEHSQMVKLWYSKSQVSKANAAYEANVLVEPVRN